MKHKTYDVVGYNEIKDVICLLCKNVDKEQASHVKSISKKLFDKIEVVPHPQGVRMIALLWALGERLGIPGYSNPPLKKKNNHQYAI